MSNYRRLFIQNSYAFLVITTNYRRPILIDNIDILRLAFKKTKETYNFEIFASVILPDHMHLIIRPENIQEYPKIIHSIKYCFSKKLQEGGMVIPPYKLSDSNLTKGDKGIWQRRYWEHTIQDDEDLYNHLDYIHYNPVKHGYVKRVFDWEYSSFEKFLARGNYEKDWGSLQESVKHLEKLNYE